MTREIALSEDLYAAQSICHIPRFLLNNAWSRDTVSVVAYQGEGSEDLKIHHTHEAVCM